MFSTLGGTLDPQISKYIHRQQKNLREEGGIESARVSLLGNNKELKHEKPSSLNIFPTVNNSPRGASGRDRFVTSTGRDQKYMAELPLGGEGDEYDNFYSRKMYPLKEYKEEFAKYKDLLIDRKAPKVKAK